MTSGPTPPFRADHVGSLLRPPELLAARERLQQGEIGADDLRAIEDQCIRGAVAMQEQSGLRSITDGEFRRAVYHVDFLSRLGGIEHKRVAWAGGDGMKFKDRGAQPIAQQPPSMMVVTGKVRRTQPILVDHFAFLKSVTKQTPKMCVPTPGHLHLRAGRASIPESVYPDLDEFWRDISAAIREELLDLHAAGCRYVQLDETCFATLTDAGVRDEIRRRGEDPDALPAVYANMINMIVAERPADLCVVMHTCRGNFRSSWMASGGYDAVAEAVFETVNVDGLFLEYDDERSGGFGPLRHVPRERKVVLGLVSSKTGRLESKDELKRRIDAASKHFPIENLGLSPQCGFASTLHGNQLSQDDQRRKLDLVVEVADSVWGSA
ncbi:MAG: 5-methyltetrahydropteroyltriglutamate--homocysteine S-methyltransferase [Burkholderiales bacterium]